MFFIRKLSMLFIISCLSLSCHLFSGESDFKHKKLVVVGEGTVLKPADQFRLTVGVITQGKTAETALFENGERMNRVIADFKNLGLDEKDYQTSQFSVRPLYSQRPKLPPPNWNPQIVGYEVENKLSIKTEKIKMAGKIIDTATAAKANSINNIHFTLKNPRDFRKEAVELATINAMDDANNLAMNAGVRLGKILLLSTGHRASVIPRAEGAFFAKSQAFTSTPVESGDVEIHASVKIIYEIN